MVVAEPLKDGEILRVSLKFNDVITRGRRVIFWEPGSVDHPDIENLFPTYGSLDGLLVTFDKSRQPDMDIEIIALRLMNDPRVFFALHRASLRALSPLELLALSCDES